jgi:hypothetical protein
VHEPARGGDIISSTVSAEQARARLGWEPTIPMRTGILDLLGIAAGGA